jgi:hypothetical protein
MKRPSTRVIAIVGAIAAFAIIEIILWWPDKSRKTEAQQEPETTEPLRPEQPPQAKPQEPPAPIAQAPAPPASEAPLTLEQLGGCTRKPCGAPCVWYCDPSDGRCTPQGKRGGACNAEGECTPQFPPPCGATANPKSDSEEL